MIEKTFLSGRHILTMRRAFGEAPIFGTPSFVYNERLLEDYAQQALAFPNEYGLTVRFAMKANPNATILRLFDKKGIHIDASSGYEVERAIKAGIEPQKIQLTGQELPKDLRGLLGKGIVFNACSLHQLETVGRLMQETRFSYPISIRINPGKGSGGNNRTNVGGPESSFGIWHEQIDEVKKIINDYKITVKKLHTHIGSGSDPAVWQEVSQSSVALLDHFPDAETLNLGGGFKVARVADEVTTDLQECGAPIKEEFKRYFEKTGRKIHLEIEPGTYLVANAGCIVSTIIDIKSTSKYTFLIVNSGMTENTRISLYGAQHPLEVIPLMGGERGEKKYLISGHCCESGDTLTTKRGDAESLKPRLLLEAKIGDLLVIGGAGAYCAGMSTKHYNSFPEAAELMLTKMDQFEIIRNRGSLDDIVRNEHYLRPHL